MIIGFNSARYDSEENPVPKSSSATPIPRPVSCSIISNVSATSMRATPSVISMMRRSAGNVEASNSLFTNADKPGSWNWRAERFTVTKGSESEALDRPHSPAATMDSWRAKAPRSKMRSLCSASGMKTPGGTHPRWWCQRISASKPTTSRVESRTMGW